MMTWLSWFPDAAWKGAILLLAALIGVRALRRQPAAIRHGVWVAALGGMLVMPVLSAATPLRIAIPTLPTASPSPAPEARPGRPADLDTDDRARPAARLVSNDLVSPTERAAPGPSTMQRSGFLGRLASWSSLDWLLVVWLTGVFVLGARFLVASLAVRRLWPGSAPAGARLELALEQASAKAGLRSVPRLIVSEHVMMPCAYGWMRPAVVLPAEAREWSGDRLEVVLLHEATHIRRGDYVTHMLAEIARIVHWYNPLVWIASRALRAEAERATDERVMNAGAVATDYADHLLSIVRGAGTRRVPAPLLPLAQRTEFEGRLIAILEYTGVRRMPARAVAFASILAVLFVGGVASLGAAAPVTASASRADGTSTSATESSPYLGSEARTPRGTTRAVAQNVADTGSTTAALLGALGDSVASVRLAVVEALGGSRDTIVVRALMRVLREDDSADVRRAAANSLGEIGDALAVPALVQALDADGDMQVRIEAAEALGEFEGSAAASDALARALSRASDAMLKVAVIESLDNLDDKRAAGAIASALRDEHPGVRAAAADALNGIDDRSVIPALIGAARDSDVNVRRAVIDALGDFDDSRVADVLANALNDSDADVRAAAANGLGNIDDLRTAPRQLIAALDDANADVRHAAAHALGNIADPASLSALIRRVGDANVDVRLAVVEAITEFADASATAALRTALRDSNAEIRETAARALGDRSRR